MCSIDRRGFILPKNIATPQQIKLIQNKLTVTPVVKSTFVEPESFKVYGYDSVNYYLPRFWALENICANPIINFKKNPNSLATFKFSNKSLRSDQCDIIGTMLDYYLETDVNGRKTGRLKQFQSKIINIGTGRGKTVLALYGMCFLKLKTVIVTHTEPIEKQWKERINQYVDGAVIGYIKGKKYKIDGCNIVITKVQSLMKSTLPLEELLKDFDLVIYDEMHHYASKVFSNVLRMLATPYNISLTATFERPDKLECVLNWYLGDIGYKTEGQLDYNIDIEVLRFGIKGHKKFKELMLPGANLNIGKMMTNLTLVEERNNMIINKLHDTFRKEPERHILLVSHRLDQLFYLKEILEKTYPGEIGMIIGKKGQKIISDNESYDGMKKKDKVKMIEEMIEEIGNKRIILGIYNLAKEGVDIASVCSVWLLTPMCAALQVCGRMLRRKKEEYLYTPTIVEIKDNISIYGGMHYARLKQYKECYLQSLDSSLTYYDCNDETNFEIKFGHKVNLGDYAINQTKAKVKKNPFDSDSDSDDE